MLCVTRKSLSTLKATVPEEWAQRNEFAQWRSLKRCFKGKAADIKCVFAYLDLKVISELKHKSVKIFVFVYTLPFYILHLIYLGSLDQGKAVSCGNIGGGVWPKSK